MYRIETHNTASAPFSGLAEAQEAHIALVGQVDALTLPDKVRDAAAREAMVEIAKVRRAIRSFEWRLSATGAVIADPQQRSLAQSLLDYWALRHVELRDRAGHFGQSIADRPRPFTRRPVSPRTLLPVDQGLATSLAETAETTYLALTDDDAREKARQLFLAIANPYSSLWAIDPDIAARFAAAGVIVPASGASGTRYALAHDSVAQEWRRLETWMTASREEEHQYKLVRENALNWKATGLDDALPQGEALSQARNFAARDAAVAEFVAGAEDAERRRKRYARSWITGGGAVIALLLTILLVDYIRGHQQQDTQQGDTVKSSDTPSELKAAQAVRPPVRNAVCPAKADASGWMWIGSPGNSQVFKDDGKVIEPDAVARDTALLTRAWINLRAGVPTNDERGYSKNAAAVGTVSARSVALVIDEPWIHKTDEGLQYWVNVRLPSSVYLQVPNPAEPTIARLATALSAAGLVTPPVQRLDMPPGLNEVRYYYDQDKGRAEQVACLANQVLDPVEQNRVVVRSLANTSLAAKVSNGTIELWVFPRFQPATEVRTRGQRAAADRAPQT
ncbi:MAG: hypothetical protein ACREBO_07440 [Novosphingobium sp.]